MLEQESDGIMPPLRSNDESIQRRKKHLEANQKLIQGSDRILTPLRSDGKRVGDHKKKYETRINAIGAGLYLSRSVLTMGTKHIHTSTTHARGHAVKVTI